MTAIPDRNPQDPGLTSADSPSSDPGPVVFPARSADSGAGPTTGGNDGSTPASPVEPPPLAKWLLLYTLLRLATLVVLTALLYLLMPLILALLFAVVLALPLSWVVFAGVRRRVNEAMAVKASARRGERDRLRAALDGREPQ